MRFAVFLRRLSAFNEEIPVSYVFFNCERPRAIAKSKADFIFSWAETTIVHSVSVHNAILAENLLNYRCSAVSIHLLERWLIGACSIDSQIAAIYSVLKKTDCHRCNTRDRFILLYRTLAWYAKPNRWSDRNGENGHKISEFRLKYF